MNRKLLSILPITSIVAATISLSSCGPQTSHFVEPQDLEKQKICDEGSSVCSYELTLKEELDPAKYEIDVETTITSSSTLESKKVKITDSTKASIWGKLIRFDIEISLEDTNAVEVWAKFDVKLTCKSLDSNSTAWTQTIKDYKITGKADAERHQITTNSKISCLDVVSDVEQVTSEGTIKLTISSERTDGEYTTAKLTIFAGENHIVVDAPAIPRESSVNVTYTVDQLKSLFTAQGYSIKDNDAFTFKLVNVGGFTFSNNRLYRINYNGDFELVPDSELDSEELANNFLVYNPTYQDYKMGYGNEGLQTYLSSLTGNAHEICLLKCTKDKEGNDFLYFTAGHGPISGTVDLTIHGLLDSQGNKLSKLRTYNDIYEGNPEGIGANGLKFTIENVNMVGRSAHLFDYDYHYDGFKCPYLNCTNCDFTGAYTASGTECHFTNCTFDSTNLVKSSGKKTYTAIWFYTGSTAEFNNCTFTSNGKAVKIFTDGANAGTYNFLFKDCTFNLIEEHVEIVEYPIDIAANTLSGTAMYKVSLKNCTKNDIWTNAIKELKETLLEPKIPDPPTNILYHPYEGRYGLTAQHISISIDGGEWFAPTLFWWDW